ncbi:hypothetical protein SAMN06265371_11226 [Lutibacter agarilyticus]|uniref:DUF2264 domain-containing protein n=1 Tax=Lutibacter agarilyticus TaxID=1109740 RepID=A0A238Z2Z7_9FLAO|nr:DUF2264 domain-containing protein [Lutibacter agarilyticus]SNR77239.1 hypothetical protein SAMN06265371_11226 [Lutibacter agarilyticus]
MKTKFLFFSCILYLVTFSIQAQKKSQLESRAYFVDVLVNVSNPVLEALANNELKKTMPVEVSPKHINDRTRFAYLEAFGRLLSGISPWLELGPDNSKEGKLREKYIQLTLKCLKNATDPNAADYMNFSEGSQPLVDAAFLAQGLLRAPTQLWERSDKETQQHILKALKLTRKLSPGYNNWLLFTAMVEAAILKFEGEADMVRIQYALNKHNEWYLGDGTYGDGPNFHWDYYNSFVIHPMLLDIYNVLNEQKETLQNWRYSQFIDGYDGILKRAQKYAVIQEKLISPEGTYPPIGRSLTYRFGAFQLLSQIALFQKLPKTIKPSQVRSALHAVIEKHMSSKRMFTKDGWLTIGFYGHQPELAERYISTGSLYICAEIFLALGLKPESSFWADPAEDWSQKKIWADN